MSEDDAPKSAYELAMERLRKRDREQGIEERPLREDQRQRIADVRRVLDARLVEREILYQSDRRKAGTPEELEKLEREYQRDRERIVSERDAKIEESEISDSIISDGCIITGAKVTNSVVGLRSRISKGVQMDASYMMGADIYETFDDMRNDLAKGLPRVGIGEGTIIKHAIIDKNARIGNNARLLNEAGTTTADGPGGSYFIRDGIIIVPKNAVVPEGTVI